MEWWTGFLKSDELLLSVATGVGCLFIIALLLAITIFRGRARRNALQASVPEAPPEPETGLRDEIQESVKAMGETITRTMADIVRAQQVRNDAFQLKIGELSEQSEVTYDRVLSELSAKLEGIGRENSERMDAMVKAVDDKLDATLADRFDARLQKVAEQMDGLTRGIEDVRALSKDVYDLKRVLSGAKSGSMLGEAQLSMLLSDILSPEQYEEDRRIREGGERVAAAVRIPGRTSKEGVSLLPIDARFSKAASTRLMYAIDGDDAQEIEAAWADFEAELIAHAQDILADFINPPMTTDFAVLFFPSEGLYAQALRRPTMVARIQEECHVMLSGPTTLAALLNSLQMGLRTLAIERRSEEVFSMLASVRGEFVNFADALLKTQKRIHQAQDAIEDAARKSRLIEEKLRGMESFDGEKQRELYAETSEDDEFLRKMHEDWD